MKIGDLAKATGTQAETIRYYEREGLLPAPARTESNYRSYGPAHLRQLAFIRQCRSLDMTLDEIRALLRFKQDPAAHCGAADALLDEHIHHVAARIGELQRLQAELAELRAQCTAASASCGILDTLERGMPTAPAAGEGAAGDGHAHPHSDTHPQPPGKAHSHGPAHVHGHSHIGGSHPRR